MVITLFYPFFARWRAISSRAAVCAVVAATVVWLVPQALGVSVTVSGSFPTGVATQPYSGKATAGGGTAPYTYNQSNLPKGLTVNHSTGAITGTCSKVGTFTFTIYVADSASHYGKAQFSLTLTQPPVSISLAPGTVTVSSSGTQQFLATVLNTSNTAVTWKASSGSISSTGSYTAPSVTSNTQVTITATSVADATKTAKSTITVSTAAVQPVSMEIAFPPAGPYDKYYSDVQKYLMTNAIVTGVVVPLQWASVDRGPGSNPQYDFSGYDAQIAPWIGAGKKVNIVVWAVSDTPTNTATPQYVWNNLGSSNITTCSGQQIPNYFQSAFQLPYQAFLAQVIKHYGGNGSIGYIRIGIGRGGETLPAQGFGTDPCTSTFINKWGWTETTWINYVSAMLTYESTLKSPKQLMMGIDSTGHRTMPVSEAAAAVSLGIGFGNQGLEASDIKNYPTCSTDWCNLFNQYTGQVPLELQTVALSSPQGNAPVGSLTKLLPFAVSHHTTILELYCDDWLLAFDPNYPGYATYGAAYASAFKAAAQGK